MGEHHALRECWDSCLMTHCSAEARSKKQDDSEGIRPAALVHIFDDHGIEATLTKN